MREPLVASLALVGLVATGIILSVRDRVPHIATLPVASVTPAGPAGAAGSSGSSGQAGASGSSGQAGVAGATAALVPAGSASGVASAASAAGAAGAAGGEPAALLGRPLRTMVLGWELAVPLVMANEGLEGSAKSEFGKAGLEVKLTVTDRPSALENGLARGGSDREGADVVVMPLPTFVASYERLRALSPEVFLVLGWSRGRDVVTGGKAEVLTVPTSGEVTVAGDEGTPSAFVGLFALDLAGNGGPRLKLVPGGKAAEATVAAHDRSSPFEGAQRPVLLSTAEASRLVPYVAVAPHAFIERQGPVLTAWARGWMAGQRQVEADPPGAARAVGSVTGGPGPLPLLRGLGEQQTATLNDNARTFGLSGRTGATLENLFGQSWRIWRGAGVLSSPAPDAAPVSPAVVTALARSETSPPLPAPPLVASVDKGKPLLVYRQKDGEVDDQALESTVGLLAGVFERAALRVSVRKGAGVDAARTRKIVEEARGTYDLSAARLVAGTKLPGPASAASIEVFTSP